MILVIVFAFGVSTQALLYPNQSLNDELLKNVFFPAYFVIGGEYYTRTDIMNAGICLSKLINSFVPYFPFNSIFKIFVIRTLPIDVLIKMVPKSPWLSMSFI